MYVAAFILQNVFKIYIMYMYYVSLHFLGEMSLLSNVLVERYEFANKQAQLKTVIDKMGDASTRVSFTCFKRLEELYDLFTILCLLDNWFYSSVMRHIASQQWGVLRWQEGWGDMTIEDTC